MMTAAARAKKKKPTRRLGVESSETRAQLMSLAARLIRDEGCAAVTARRLAEELGLKRQIVHYYFGTIEDLLIAVIRRSVGRVHERVKQELDCEDPLRVIYQFSNSVNSALFEFSALAMRSKAIRAELQRYMGEFRKMQSKAIARHLELRGIEPSIAPAATALVVNAVAHTLAIEAELGVTEGHVETRALMEGWLRTFAQYGEWSIRAKTARPGRVTRPKARLVASRRG
jgi:AcrR family transcriptional regulator